MNSVKDTVWYEMLKQVWGNTPQTFTVYKTYKMSKVEFLIALRQFIFHDIVDRTKGK